MTSTHYPVPPVNLKQRIAALQQRGTSPIPAEQSAVSTSSSSVDSPPRGTLRDRIAKFEAKGGTPIPRGSFGLGAPPQASEDEAAKRRGQLYGSRLKSLTKPLGPPPTRRSSTTGSSGSMKPRAMSASFADSFDVMAYAESNPPSPSLTAISGADEPESPSVFSDTSTFSPSPRRNSFTVFQYEDVLGLKVDVPATLPVVDEPLESDAPAIVISHSQEQEGKDEHGEQKTDGDQMITSVQGNADGEPISSVAPTLSDEMLDGEDKRCQIVDVPADSYFVPIPELPDGSPVSRSNHVSPPKSSGSSSGTIDEEETSKATAIVQMPIYTEFVAPQIALAEQFPPSPATSVAAASSSPESSDLQSILHAGTSFPIPSPTVQTGTPSAPPIWETPRIASPLSSTPKSDFARVAPTGAALAVSEQVANGASLSFPAAPSPSLFPTPPSDIPESPIFVPKDSSTSFHAKVYSKMTEVPGVMEKLAPPPHIRGTIVEPASPSLNRELSALLAEAVQMEELLGLDSPSRELTSLASSLSVPGLRHAREGGLHASDAPPTPPPKSPNSRYSRFNSLRSLVGSKRTASRHGISSSDSDSFSAMQQPSSLDNDDDSSPAKRSLSRASSIANRMLKSPRAASYSESGLSHLSPPRTPSKRYSRASASHTDLDDLRSVPEHETASLVSKRSMLSLRRRNASPTPLPRHSVAPEPLRLALHEDDSETRDDESDWARSVLSLTGESQT